MATQLSKQCEGCISQFENKQWGTHICYDDENSIDVKGSGVDRFVITMSTFARRDFGRPYFVSQTKFEPDYSKTMPGVLIIRPQPSGPKIRK
jgi:hypothetical protein